MANLTRWDPFAELRSMRLFDDSFYRPWRVVTAPAHLEAGFPVEVSETADDIEVKASLPGVRPEEVDITVQDDVLTIKAEHKDTREDEKRDYYRREIRYGAYQRSMTLPMAVDSDKADARFENGVLTLRLPKAEALRPKQIKIAGPSTN